MEIDYGKIKIIHRENARKQKIRYLACKQCNYENRTKGGIITHLARKHNELQIRNNLYCPYFPKSYRDHGSINRRHYKNRDVLTLEKTYFYKLERYLWGNTNGNT